MWSARGTWAHRAVASTELDALADGIVAGVARRAVGEIGVGGDTAHAEVLDHVFDFANGVHSLIWGSIPQAEICWIGRIQGCCCWRETVGGFAVGRKRLALNASNQVGRFPGRAWDAY